MAGIDVDVVPEAKREVARAALVDAFGPGGATGLEVVAGGASGALTYRVEAGGRSHLLRIESLQGPMRNPHQYACMQAAAEAGVAPPVHYLDEDAGVVILPFLEQRPLAEHPGGPVGIAGEMAQLLRRLHGTPTFADNGDHLDNLAGLLGYLAGSGRVAPGLLDAHQEAYARLRAAYPWAPDTFVSAHNDPNQHNVLYDGARLWLIDWETAGRNDPFVDLATAASHCAPTPELRDELLGAWAGRPATDVDRARLTMMGWVVQLFAGTILLTIVTDPAVGQHTDLDAMSIEDFGAGIASGALVAGTPSTTHAFAKIMLGWFLQGVASPEFDRAEGILGGG